MDSIYIVYPVITAIIWSFNPAVIYRFARNSPPSFFTAIRALLAVSFIVLFTVFTGTLHFSSLTPMLVFFMVVSGVLGPGLGDIAYTRSIQLIGGSLAIVIGYLYIFFAQVFSFILFGEKLGLTELVGGTLAFLGILIATRGNNNGSRASKTGILLAFSAAVLWGFAASIISMFRGLVDPYTVSLIRSASVVVFSLIVSFMRRENRVVDKGFIIATFITGVFSWGIGMVLFTYSIYQLGVSATVVATALAPVLSQLTTRIIAKEPFSPFIVAGAILVSLGIIVHSL